MSSEEKPHCQRCLDEIKSGTHCEVCAEVLANGLPNTGRQSWLPQLLPPDTDVLRDPFDQYKKHRQIKSAESTRNMKDLGTFENDPDAFGHSE